MAESNWGDFSDVFNYLTCQAYPEGLSKVGKRALRQKAESFAVQDGVLMHKAGVDMYRRVVVDVAERDRSYCRQSSR